jgi:hypothetical protein
MDREFRRQTLGRLAKQAGVLVDVVQKHFGVAPGKKEPTKYETTLSIPGGKIHIPANAVKKDGTYNVMIHFKSKLAHPAKSGLNVVMVMANEASGKQFAGDFAKSYSKKQRGNFVAKALGTIQSYLSKKVPGAKLGKWGMSAFSGGSGAVTRILKEKNYPTEPSFVGMYDALHSSNRTRPEDMAVVQWAERNNVAKDPSKKLVIMHSAIPMTRKQQSIGVQSTTEAAHKVTGRLGVQYGQPQTYQAGTEPIAPISEAASGGVHVYQMYGKGSDTKLKDQHWAIMRAIGDSYATHLSDW